MESFKKNYLTHLSQFFDNENRHLSKRGIKLFLATIGSMFLLDFERDPIKISRILSNYNHTKKPQS
jgi:hypothetical protein